MYVSLDICNSVSSNKPDALGADRAAASETMPKSINYPQFSLQLCESFRKTQTQRAEAVFRLKLS